MPPWGRPPGGRDVGRYSEGMEEVYKYQEVDSDDEKHGGVSLDSAFYREPNGKQYFNPDELYFNDMDIRAWERRTAELDALAYGDDYGYGYLEDEGYYEDPADHAAAISEYEDMIFQGVLDKIRLARATGDPDVQLTPEELEVYQAKMLGPRAPAARPQSQPPKPRHASASTVPTSSSTAMGSTSSQIGTLSSGNIGTSASSQVGISTSSQVGTSSSGSTRAKKSSRRTSIFGIRRSKDKDKDKDKSSTRTRAPSVSSEASIQPTAPGFVVPGPNGHPVYAPINAYQSRRTRDPHAPAPSTSPGTPPRPASRSASISSDRLVPTRPTHPSDARAPRQAPPRPSPPPDMPGTFPGSVHNYRTPTPPQPPRPVSSSSRQSTQDYIDPRLASTSRSRSASIQQPQQPAQPKLVSLPLAPTEPYQYQLAGQLAQPTAPTYTRRISSGPPDTGYTSMPRRVPVPGQRAPGVVGSVSEPTIAQRVDVSDGDDGVAAGGGVSLDNAPNAEERVYKVAGSSGGGKSGSRDGERKRKSKSSRRKH